MQGLKTKFIAGVHTLFLLLGCGRQGYDAIYKTRHARKYSRALQQKRMALHPASRPSLSVAWQESSIHLDSPISRWVSFASLVPSVPDGAIAVATSRSRSLQRALASRDMTVPTGHCSIAAMSS